jgi:HK97 gp10 family phage protein
MPNALTGVRELGAQLDRLSKAARGADLRSAARAGINVAKDRAIATIPVGIRAHRLYTGQLVAPGFAQRHVAIKISTSYNATDVSAHLGVTKLAFYAVQFLERGTEKMSARPWLTPAFAQTTQAQQQAFADKLRDRLDAAVRA